MRSRPAAVSRNSSNAAALVLASVGSFARSASRPLRPYQEEIARAIVRSVLRGEGKTFSVMLARQMGKNETSALVEAYLMALHAGRGGTIVKAAPSFKPQIINSILRLKTTLDASPVTRGRWRPSFGYILTVGKAGTTFLSADASANVVGATASLLLEIDEAQDVDPDKYARDFRPMASSTNATTVLYGTAWSEDSLLARQKRINQEVECQSGERLHFEYDWTHLAEINRAYRHFVRTEFGRLGEEHPSIQTQYLLHTLSDAGRLFSEAQRAGLRGGHGRELQPDGESRYVAGIDIAGSDEEHEDAVARALVPRKDSTVITIARVERDGAGRSVCRVVDHRWWTGHDHTRQYDDLVSLLQHWQVARAVVDASGIGAGVAAFLIQRFGERVEPLVFSQQSKSRLGYDMLAMINTGRLSLYDGEGAEVRQCWTEIRQCRYQLRANEILAWGVPPNEGHDDFVVSLALCARAAVFAAPEAVSALVRAEGPEELDSW